MRVRAVCPKCLAVCDIARPKNVLARHREPGHYLTCDASGSNAAAGVAAWVERKRTKAQKTLDAAPSRIAALKGQIARLEERARGAEATLVALAKFETTRWPYLDSSETP